MRDLPGSWLASVSGGCGSTALARFFDTVTMRCGIAGETLRLRARFGPIAGVDDSHVGKV
jgi:hypothetical protein